MLSDTLIADILEKMKEPPGAIEFLSYNRGKLKQHLGQSSSEDEKLHFGLEHSLVAILK